ncbi:MAG: DUF1992 domain-containing protein [Paracoccaceae bacterium]|nr:DUF1992 domain-containing protein [Paracoccaceae bacterium]
MRSLRSLVERQIAKAQASGILSSLKGAGHPLPDRRVEARGEASISAGMRIMAEAGVLPEEFTLKKELESARSTYSKCKTDAERKEAMQQLADLELRYGIARDARRKFMT